MSPSAGDAVGLFAIPGSHDWYDGLVNFTSIFCRSRNIGGWRTSQARSYFALRLRWLWGIDIQFGASLDEVQLQYFGNEGFAPLHHQDQKHFLRLHIDARGARSGSTGWLPQGSRPMCAHRRQQEVERKVLRLQ